MNCISVTALVNTMQRSLYMLLQREMFEQQHFLHQIAFRHKPRLLRKNAPVPRRVNEVVHWSKDASRSAHYNKSALIGRRRDSIASLVLSELSASNAHMKHLHTRRRFILINECVKTKASQNCRKIRTSVRGSSVVVFVFLRIRIQSAKVRGSNEDGRNAFLAVS